MKQAVALRHVAFEDLGTIAGLLDARGWRARTLDAGIDDLGGIELDAGDLLIVLGGPIGAYEDDRYPFLRDELRLIERSLARDARVLGICLGSQLLARALGARVYRGAGKEIGIAAVALTSDGSGSCLAPLEPARLVLHWHGDTFDLPHGATRLASTALTPNQAFARGPRVLGLQFHVEVVPARFEAWLIGNTGELTAERIDVAALRRQARAHLPAIACAGELVIASWLDAAEFRGQF
jgi:GMP synthase (glutamine-hydrolysing)